MAIPIQGHTQFFLASAITIATVIHLQYKVSMCNEACVLVKTSKLSATESRAD